MGIGGQDHGHKGFGLGLMVEALTMGTYHAMHFVVGLRLLDSSPLRLVSLMDWLAGCCGRMM
jgi:hypothetical protein